MTESPPVVDPDQRWRLEALASVVQSELVAAGLPVVPNGRPVGAAGAIVTVEGIRTHRALP
ncbi:hypothetical protein [Amycolatopsis dongchuanensis]|uniref:Uncharacterized protein n=1 Tax=Amycolatopsis dongchuanensis TaxID=1070866 RepID=A0ABP8VP27_9PSEU